MKNKDFIHSFRQGRRLLAGFATSAAVLSAFALASCSSDDMPDSPQTPASPSAKDAIAYNVVAGNQTRAAGIYNSNNIPNSFYVSAWAMDNDPSTNDIGHTYMKSDLIKNTGTATAQNWNDQNGVRYWPNDGQLLNFFATNATTGELTFEESGQGSSKEITNPEYQISANIAAGAPQQSDLLYATAFDQKKTATGAAGQTTQAVNLDFHHALSQVVFTAQCSNPHIEVKIGNISIGGLAGSGTLKMAANRVEAGTPAWSIPANYTPQEFSSDPDGEQGAVTVTSAVTDITSASSQSQYALMLLPQKASAADPTAASPWSGQNAYLKVQCTIFNVAVGEDGSSSATDTMIFGDYTDMGGGFIRQEYGTLYIPVAVDWQPGKRYVINLQFGNGNGGYNQDGTAALIPIKYNITADAWSEAS